MPLKTARSHHTTFLLLERKRKERSIKNKDDRCGVYCDFIVGFTVQICEKKREKAEKRKEETFQGFSFLI
jgi:hypothetical protein